MLKTALGQHGQQEGDDQRRPEAEAEADGPVGVLRTARHCPRHLLSARAAWRMRTPESLILPTPSSSAVCCRAPPPRPRRLPPAWRSWSPAGRGDHDDGGDRHHDDADDQADLPLRGTGHEREHAHLPGRLHQTRTRRPSHTGGCTCEVWQYPAEGAGLSSRDAAVDPCGGRDQPVVAPPLRRASRRVRFEPFRAKTVERDALAVPLREARRARASGPMLSAPPPTRVAGAFGGPLTPVPARADATPRYGGVDGRGSGCSRRGTATTRCAGAPRCSARRRCRPRPSSRSRARAGAPSRTTVPPAATPPTPHRPSRAPSGSPGGG